VKHRANWNIPSPMPSLKYSELSDILAFLKDVQLFSVRAWYSIVSLADPVKNGILIKWV